MSFNTLAGSPAIFFNHRLWDGYSALKRVAAGENGYGPAAVGLGSSAGGFHYAAGAPADEVYLASSEFASYLFSQSGYVGSGVAFTDYGYYQCSCSL